MRFHVLGIGPIGSLVAFHLRRSLPTYPISLIVRTKSRARDLRMGGGIAIEHGGVPITQGGYDVELFDPLQEVVVDLVYNKRGEMRLPPGAARTWRREGELGPEESLDVVQRPIQSVIVCTKADATLPVFKRIKQRLTSASTVVLLQNGMGVYDRLIADIFRNPQDRPQFVLATTTHAARSKLHGHMIHTVHVGDGDLSFGIVPDPLGERDFEKSLIEGGIEYLNRPLSLDDIAPPYREGESNDRCASLRGTIAALNSLTELNPSWLTMTKLDVQLKRKLVVNSVINPLTSISQSANGTLFADTHTCFMAQKVCEEAAAIFAAEATSEPLAVGGEETMHRTLGPPVGLRAHELESEVYRITRRTSQNFSSMLQDIWKGRRTEVEYINGYLHRLGVKYGVPTPHNDMLYAIIKMKETVVPAARI